MWTHPETVQPDTLWPIKLDTLTYTINQDKYSSTVSYSTDQFSLYFVYPRMVIFIVGVFL